jgi:starch-binding outer membrane protein, SusD/RagB family
MIRPIVSGRRFGRDVMLVAAVSCAVLNAGCSMDGITGKNDLPSELVDPASAKTERGAYGNYIIALTLLRDAVGEGIDAYVNITGLLADEGIAPEYGVGANPDTRIIPEQHIASIGFSYTHTYSALQRVRGQANQAQLLLRDYYPSDKSGPLMAHMLAAKGYAELMLAELYCSGIPLSTLDYEGDYTLKPGSTTEDVLNHAIAQFDSAIALAGDSTRILNLAQTGKGRALLQLGNVAEARQAVTDVPDTFQYDLKFSVSAKACGLWNCAGLRLVHTVPDREGDNGLPYITEWDDRLPVIASVDGFVQIPDIPKIHTIRLASGVEAQLIRVEAELNADDANWLSRLNALRTTCTDPLTCASPAPAGIGGVAGLSPLADPGTPSARIDLLFRERAYWTFLTGHRQGDMRRLVRRYGRTEAMVYPTGPYNDDARYGSDVNVPVPLDERILNPHYTGCIDRGA